MLKFYNVPQNDETEISEFPKLILERDVEKEGFPSQFSCVHVSCDVESEKYRGGGGVFHVKSKWRIFHISQHKGIYLSTVVELHWNVYEKPDECRVKETACTLLVNK